MLSAIEMFKAGKHKEARTMIGHSKILKSMKKFTSLCIRNLELWGDTELKQDQANYY